MADDTLMHTTVPFLPGMEGALNPLDEAQLRSAEARRIFESSNQAEDWMDDYFALIGEGWSWRQAVYMLWEAQPRKSRHPATQGQLATEILGLSSDRVIRDWKASNPIMETRIRKLTLRALFHARADVLAALAASASDPSPRSHPDRKLYVEMTGDYIPRQAVSVDAPPPDNMDVVTSDDLAALANIPVHEALPEESNDDGA